MGGRPAGCCVTIPGMGAVIIDAARTPFGKYRGGFSGVRVDDLATLPVTELLARHGTTLDPATIDDVIYGNTNGAGEENRNIGRMVVLLAGLPTSVPGVTVNRLCASGGEAMVQAARAVATGDADLLIAGGVEGMTRAPFVLPRAERASPTRSKRCRRRSAGDWSTRRCPRPGRFRSVSPPSRSPSSSVSTAPPWTTGRCARTSGRRRVGGGRAQGFRVRRDHADGVVRRTSRCARTPPPRNSPASSRRSRRRSGHRG